MILGYFAEIFELIYNNLSLEIEKIPLFDIAALSLISKHAAFYEDLLTLVFQRLKSGLEGKKH